MINDVFSCLTFLVIIAGRKQKDAILDALTNSGGRLINIVYGKGSVKSTYLKDLFGLVPEEHKALITCVIPCEKADAALNMLLERFRFDRPNTGIAFTIPIEKLSI